ncbi:FtsX-like permease family protein [Marisediminicola sp. LYQ85]|uniref:FtsX-like permease family protein n=1 Tax=Marisediminicola sp. LYQ85 TaxID=3391062 RepID=UPI003983A944
MSAVSLNQAQEISAADFEGIIGFVSMPAFLSAVTTIIVVTGVANLTVDAQRQTYARWQIGGVLPKRITGVVLLQLAFFGMVASVVGVLIALPAAQPVFDWLASRAPSLIGVSVGQSFLGAAIVLVVTTSLMVLGGHRAARRAGKVPAVEVLSAPVDPKTGMSVARWVLSAAGLSATVGLSAGLRDVGILGIGQNGLFVGLALSTLLAALAPLVLSPFLTMCTRAVPLRVSAAWFLARNACRYRIAQSTSAVVPLTVGLVLVGSFTSVFSMFVDAQRVSGVPHQTAMDGEANLVIFGAPLVLAIVAAAVTVFMSGRAREREFALINAAGGTPRMIVRSAIYEALIYAVTALLLALIIVLITSTIVWSALTASVPGTAFIVDLAPLAVMFAIGFAGLLAATVLPTLHSLRSSVRESLAA